MKRNNRRQLSKATLRWTPNATLLTVLAISIVAGFAVTPTAEAVEEGKTLHGTVISTAGPVADVTVVLKQFQETFSEIARTVTDQEGAYSFQSVPTEAMLIVEANHGGVRHIKIVSFPPESPSAQTVDFNLTATVYGKVLDENQSPISSITMQLANVFGEGIVNTTTNALGEYSIQGLEVNETYYVYFLWLGVPYTLSVNTGETPTEASFTVYPTTTSDEEIEVSVYHIVLENVGDHLTVREIGTYMNRGPSVFNNSKLQTSLPLDRYNFQTSIMDCCFFPSSDQALFDPMQPILPNEQFDMWMQYDVKLEGSEKTFEKKINYNTDSIYFLIKNEEGTNVEDVKGLTYTGPTELNGVEYLVFSGSAIKAGDSVAVKIVTPGLIDQLLFQPMLTITVAAGAGASVTVGYFAVRRACSRKGSMRNLKKEKNQIFSALSQLEAEFKTGNISRRNYEREKAAYKKRGIEIMRKMEGVKEEKTDDGTVAELYAKRQALESTAAQLESDYQEGKISRETYEKLKAKYERQLALTLEKLAGLEKNVQG